MGKLIDLTNQRFGSLVVISRGKNNNQGKPQWNCICDCGEEYLVDGCRLRSGKAKKCDNTSIGRCCKGIRKSAGGYHWKYV